MTVLREVKIREPELAVSASFWGTVRIISESINTTPSAHL